VKGHDKNVFPALCAGCVPPSPLTPTVKFVPAPPLTRSPCRRFSTVCQFAGLLRTVQQKKNPTKPQGKRTAWVLKTARGADPSPTRRWPKFSVIFFPVFFAMQPRIHFPLRQQLYPPYGQPSPGKHAPRVIELTGSYPRNLADVFLHLSPRSRNGQRVKATWSMYRFETTTKQSFFLHNQTGSTSFRG